MSSVKEIQVVRNACRAVEVIASEQPIGVSELARRVGIDKSAAHRLAITLHAAGWLDRDTERRWCLSATLPALTTDPATTALVGTVLPLLEGLRDETGETAMLVVPEGRRLRITAVAESRENLRVTATAGVMMPPRRSAALRAVAAHLAGVDLAAWRAVDPDLTEDALAAVRDRGWSVNDAELTPDARGVAAALCRPDGSPVGAVVLCGPATRFRHEDATSHGRRVASVAADWHGGRSPAPAERVP